MILCSLLSSDEMDTHNHASSALEVIGHLTRCRCHHHRVGLLGLGGAPRTIRRSLTTPRQHWRRSGVRRVVVVVVCGPALTQLLISADEFVSRLGCSFASSLISPLLTDPWGSGQALRRCVAGPDGGESNFQNGDDGLFSYRCAALALVEPAICFPGLLLSLSENLHARIASGLRDCRSWTAQ